MSFDRLAATLSLEEPVGRVNGVSAARAKILERMGIATVRDLLCHFPRRYLDLTSCRSVRDARIGESCTIQGVIDDLKLKRPRPRLSLVEISLFDGTGILVVTMFRQPWLMDRLTKGQRLAVAGKVEFNYGFKRMTNPFLEGLEDGTEFVGRIIPIHPATEKLSAGIMRRLVANALAAVRGLYDPLPVSRHDHERFMGRQAAFESIHFPRTMDEVAEAKRRLAYEELFLLQLYMMREAAARGRGKTPVAHVIDGERVQRLFEALPFELTADQQSAIGDLFGVMQRPVPANHLILGDVGTGKTAVAAFGLAVAADTDAQALFMAPTEVLARQHGESLGALLEKAGVSSAVLVGSTPQEERARLLERFSRGELDVLIGTHALLEDDVVGRNVSFVVIDEQQRFGVEQRAKLLAKGSAPDALFLTATPIPRTMALALFGNFTMSYLTQKPQGGGKRTTTVLSSARKGEAFEAAREALSRGEQVFIVCPLIADSKGKGGKGKGGPFEDGSDDNAMPLVEIDDDADYERLGEEGLTAATQEAKRLQSTVFADWRVGLLHGGMPAAEKREVMEEFRANEIQVLVSTTVIEVGVDVPNATVMIIEDADRFGLSQLHQLRGRVGRGEKPGEVFLLSSTAQRIALERLSALQRTDDGFVLANYDLSLRHEGDLLGNRQSGASALRLVNVVRDEALIEAAHADAERIFTEDPDLQGVELRPLARELRCALGDGDALLGG